MNRGKPQTASRLNFTNEQRGDALTKKPRPRARKDMDARRKQILRESPLRGFASEAATNPGDAPRGKPHPLRGAEKAAARAANRLDAAQANLPVWKKLVLGKSVDVVTGKSHTRLRFEEFNPKQPDRFHLSATGAVSSELHRQISKREEENIGVQAAHETEKAGESVAGAGAKAYRAHRLKPYREVEKAGRQLGRANIRVMRAKAAGENPRFSTNPISRWHQRRVIRKEYAAMKKAGGGSQRFYQMGAGVRGIAASKAGKVTQFLSRRRVSLPVLALGLMLLFVLNGLNSCAPLAQTIITSFVIGTYLATEEDVLAAERAYRNMENELQAELDNYGSRHPGYDEYRVGAQDIWHDPHALIAIISAYHGGEEWTIDSAYGTLERYFKLQYILTQTVATETRYRKEERTGYREETNPETGEVTLVPYTYEENVPYTYTICHVKLVNKILSHLPVYTMSRTNLGLYALYMSTLGNMPDIFRGNPYASALKNPLLYDVPEELLTADAQFARLIEEAEKYLGYPYVWGGDSPETSFDCSGFISYVFTNSGVYNTGRLGATGLYGACRKITPEEAQPGDLIFFAGTLGEGVEGNDGITHVGLYVGGGMMIHCGSPITYADLSDSYWQDHFYGWGRIPYARN